MAFRIVQWGKILSTENRRQVNLRRISCFLIPKNVFHVKGYVISVKMVQKRILFIYQCCDQRLPKLDSSMHPFWIKFAGSPSSPWSQPTRSLHLVPNIYRENVDLQRVNYPQMLFRVSSKCIKICIKGNIMTSFSSFTQYSTSKLKYISSRMLP